MLFCRDIYNFTGCNFTVQAWFAMCGEQADYIRWWSIIKSLLTHCHRGHKWLSPQQSLTVTELTGLSRLILVERTFSNLKCELGRMKNIDFFFFPQIRSQDFCSNYMLCSLTMMTLSRPLQLQDSICHLTTPNTSPFLFKVLFKLLLHSHPKYLLVGHW